MVIIQAFKGGQHSAHTLRCCPPEKNVWTARKGDGQDDDYLGIYIGSMFAPSPFCLFNACTIHNFRQCSLSPLHLKRRVIDMVHDKRTFGIHGFRTRKHTRPQLSCG